MLTSLTIWREFRNHRIIAGIARIGASLTFFNIDESVLIRVIISIVCKGIQHIISHFTVIGHLIIVVIRVGIVPGSVLVIV